MSRIVIGIGASHTTLMNTQWDQVDHLGRAHDFRDALAEAARRLKAAAPDAVVILGSNHFRGFWLDLIPPFTIGVGEVLSSGEHGTPKGALNVDAPLGLALCEHMIASAFDVAFSARMTVDHGISHAAQWIVGTDGPPILPIVINSFAAPLPPLARCMALGAALGDAIRGIPGDRRIAVIATGGLSHQLPFPDWRDPISDDDHFLVESWRSGRDRWTEFEARRRAIVVGAPARINEQFDRDFLVSFATGRLAEMAASLDDESLIRRAGNGASEIRAWLAMAAALRHRGGEVLAYAPMPEWLTGMGVAIAHDFDQSNGDL